jgi:hypothetical protein
MMKDAAKSLMLTTAFQAEAIGEGGGANEKWALNIKNNEALARVKTKHAT